MHFRSSTKLIWHTVVTKAASFVLHGPVMADARRLTFQCRRPDRYRSRGPAGDWVARALEDHLNWMRPSICFDWRCHRRHETDGDAGRALDKIGEPMSRAEVLISMTPRLLFSPFSALLKLRP
ncbi:hypothetical protein RCCGE510_29131 (plasmid) [Rhizobium sp. CCGE 510]|nr:hypothetical protein RCCGE510_29131 [Rhizobium sp. CCGE 510]